MRLSKAFFILVATLALGLGCGEGEPQGEECTTPGTTELYETCSTGDDCASCLCFAFNMGDTLCTQACEDDTDCPAPSTGCNGKGVCKRPGGLHADP